MFQIGEFRFLVATTPDLLDAVHRLRYQVYVDEYGYEKPEAHPAGLEKDAFDSRSIHMAALDGQGRVVGTIRLILNSDLGLPALTLVESHYRDKNPSSRKIVEVSRFALTRSLRGKAGEEGFRELDFYLRKLSASTPPAPTEGLDNRVIVLLGLIHLMFTVMREIHATDLYIMAERRLWRRKVEALERLERERTGLLLLTLHQIGSPLTVFRWSLENLVDQSIKHGGPLKEAIQDHAKEMEHGLTQLSTIFNELQEASQIDTGTLTYNRELTSLPEVINETIITLDLELQRRRQKIVQSVDADLRLPLDRKLIAGVLRELLQNAMTFSPHDSQITLAAHRQGQRVLVEITDHGCGIPGDEMARVFDKFMRGSQAHLYQPNGSGLGLYIARGIVRRAGGEVWVRSREGKGTTVSFTLPC
jgi:N-acyl amino acid synthase of PEP-CTERM/exosortase system